MKKKLRKVLAYVYMPILFTVIGFAVIYFAARPIITMASNLVPMLLVETDKPVFDSKLESIFDPPPEVLDPPVESENPEDTANTVKLSSGMIPLNGQQYGELRCDRVGIYAPVYYDDTSEILRVGVGQYKSTWPPGFGRKILLGGHNNTFFLNLRNVQEGDVFVFTTNYGVYEYVVTGTKIVNESDTEALDLYAEEEQLILYTCWPYERLATRKTDRFCVLCDRISGPDVVN